MTWKQIEGYNGLYEVSDTGLVRSLKFGKKRILSPGKLRNGYLIVKLCKDGKLKNMRVHRLVAAAFIPNPLGLATVNHKNELKTDNRVSNLEWLSLTDNLHYGTGIERGGIAKKNRPDISKPVCQLDQFGNVINQFPSMAEAERQTGITQSSISEVCNGRQKTAGGYFWRYA